MKSINSYIACLLAGILLQGCQSEMIESTEMATSSHLNSVSDMPRYTYVMDVAAITEDVPKDAQAFRVETQRRFAAANRAMYPIILSLLEDTLPPVDETIRRTREVLWIHRDSVYFDLIRQEVATRLVDAYWADRKMNQIDPRELAKRPLTPEQVKVISFATEHLVDSGNPNAHLIAGLLQSLKGTWTDEQIRDAARRATLAAEKHLGSQCKSCPGKADRAAHISNGLKDLAALRQ